MWLACFFKEWLSKTICANFGASFRKWRFFSNSRSHLVNTHELICMKLTIKINIKPNPVHVINKKNLIFINLHITIE